MQNQLILGDSLEVLKEIQSESVDLIYIDPPFFSNRNYEVIWGDEGEIRSFKDRWSGGMDHYINWLYERVEECYRVLKKTGSMYLHCDWHADAYIRVQILDKIFGMKNFRNEIVWAYRTTLKVSSRHLGRDHDSIFLYGKTEKFKMYPDKTDYPPSESTLKRWGKYADKDGFVSNKYFAGSKSTIINTKDETKGFNINHGVPRDVWDINHLAGNNLEKIGYPTQKPEALLERIIKASSNKGDVVLDCFCGGGTTVAVAGKLGRKFIGIDQSVQAIKVSEARLDKISHDLSYKAEIGTFSVKLHKYDYDTIRYKEAFEFENWIIEQFGGEYNEKQRGDFGLDGKKNGAPIQVKRSDNIGRNVVDNFKSAIGRFYGSKYKNRLGDKEVDGYIIAFSFGRGAVQEVARLKMEDGLLIELVCVEDIIPLKKKPEVSITFEDLGLDDKEKREIKFNAVAKSKIEFFQWDLNFKEEDGFNATEMIDKEGEQLYKFAEGTYVIACKAIDLDGIESVETIKLKVNGGVKNI